jgi:SAM-dependent methyltransferase
MKNADRWQPSKYVMANGRLVPSKDTQELAVSSRLIGRLLTDRYQPALATHARGKLLDLGCGKVPFYEAYRDHVDAATCVDWPSTLHVSEHVDTFCDLSQALPFDDASFDTVLSSDVIEHLPDPVLAFGEIGRILRPGGTLVLNTPFFYMLHEVPFDFYRHTRYSLERLCGLAGLHVVQLEEIGGLADVLADLVSKGASTIPVVGSPISIAVQSGAYAFSRTGLGRRARNASASRFPLGYFLVARKGG